MNTQVAANWSVVQGTEPKEWYFLCRVKYHRASGSPAECVLTRASLFFWCSNLKQQCVCVGRRGKLKMGFGSTEAVWMWSREAKQQTHPESKWFLKKGKEKPQSIYITEEKECLSFISHSLTVTSFHSCIPAECSQFLEDDKLSQLKIRRKCWSDAAVRRWKDFRKSDEKKIMMHIMQKQQRAKTVVFRVV